MSNTKQGPNTSQPAPNPSQQPQTPAASQTSGSGAQASIQTVAGPQMIGNQNSTVAQQAGPQGFFMSQDCDGKST